MDLFPWQESVLADWAFRDPSDRPSHVTCGLDVPRQNGKNAILEAYELYLTAVCGWHVLHTAHRVKTTKKSFRRLARYFEDRAHPELAGLVRQIRRTNGEEAIYLANGGSIEFIARTNGSARGFDDIQLVVFDEAQELTDAQYDAIAYTLSASSTGERQIIYTGTPPNEKSPGTVFARMRAAVLRGETSRSTWSSWAQPECPPRGATFEDVLPLVYESNPSMGYVLEEDYTASEFAGSSVDGFAHERLDWFSPMASSVSVIDRETWDAAAIAEIGTLFRGKSALAVKFSPDGASYALAGCKTGRRGSAVELVRLGSTEGGTRALAEEVFASRRRMCCVVVDGMAGANALCDNLVELGAPRGYVVRPRAQDVIAAAVGFKDELKAGKLHHTAQPELTESAIGCTRRDIGTRGGWGFGSTENADSAPVEAAALALWGARNTKRNPRRKQRML